MEYRILQASNATDLQRIITKYLGDGWSLRGNIVTANSPHNPRVTEWFHAVVKTSPNEQVEKNTKRIPDITLDDEPSSELDEMISEQEEPEDAQSEDTKTDPAE